MKITEAEIIDAIREAATQLPARPEGAHSLKELCRATGVAREAMLDHLARLKATGRLEVVRIVQEGIDGRRAKVSAYRVLPPKSPRKSRAA